LNSLFFLLRLDVSRQEQAAKYGLLSFLSKIKIYRTKVNRFAVPLLCEYIYNAYNFQQLWENKLMDVIMSLLNDVCWKYAALEGIVFWFKKANSGILNNQKG
jgi:hypothetical protein